MESKTRSIRNLTLIGYLGIVILIPTWIWFLAPPVLLSPLATTIIWWLPALLPMRGLLLNKPFTYAWSGFLAVFYISQAITTLISSDTEQFLALIEIILACCWFIGASLFSRWRSQELAAKLTQ